MKETLHVLDLIRAWAGARNLVRGSNVRAQLVKLVEELGELAAAELRGDHDKMIDSIGDMVVVLTVLSEQIGMCLEDCIYIAYNEIKDRKGRMENGVFIKESVAHAQ